ncbi:universal stress protein [Mycolicibacterium confluentis]|uniref:Universal stress protein n=1 Tax=Mycolicibacterium confluentis TaxID=28047 RepID=A0A7I7XUS7_9MYCO|nr:universal stress protein [Mycolicibacterium confluentis]MCV7322290.1 universal stress protein [Mycolicibacterium confluentis]ORV28389.1 universal stress protein [Mycolicibacterium confluentis]BBZ33026.1 universal stress protein [Mycolicibacterium confluentis]
MSVSTEHVVLVGVDGSPSSNAAVEWAARDAGLRGVPLVLVHVTPEPRVTLGVEIIRSAEVWRRLEDDARQILAQSRAIAERISASAEPIRIDELAVSDGVVSGLVALSEDADMLVVGCRGLGSISGRLLGSVSSGLVHHALCPVTIVHDERRGSAEDMARLPVVLGVDGSPASTSATAVAFDEASRRGVELIALHAWADNVSIEFAGTDWDLLHERAAAALAERLAGWRERYPDVTVRRIVVPDRAARHLITHSHDAQLVVVGSRGRGGFAGMLLGSVSSAVVEAAHSPVIVVRPS